MLIIRVSVSSPVDAKSLHTENVLIDGRHVLWSMIMRVYIWIAAYLLAINIVGFFSMYLDKRKARKRMWRIPEATLFLIALIGGSIGSIAGMYLFRHKTRHWYFVYGMPVILLLQIGAVVALLMSPIEIGTI